ncbi:hypothetical protein K458DRAFT_360883 [Lentithecium fluviatile CBS 122367]|uniref:peptidylprolyl isomerase n=1 Tax=Lentithecium fluviatile CBS 122367 TaxID=1168545 RepID=A0A6G1JC35_9PLEO|nr:hypothetical protein K458DRAFT_360883 [Lentithecium fluviatile CBS 122367]
MRPFNTLYALPLSLLLPPSASAQSLGIEVTKSVDCTRKTQVGDKIKVNYKGTLQSDGSQFDSSYDRGVPFEFRLGKGQVIAGWDQGLLDMCIGEGRKLTIPPSMGYGDDGSGPIPGGATLIFETELMGIHGVQQEAAPQRPTVAKPTEKPQQTTETPTPIPTLEPSPSSIAAEDNVDDNAEDKTNPTATALDSAKPTSDKASPMEADDDNGECHLLGPYALLVQGALGLLAVSSLVYKRWRERPRRPIKIWFFDVSKQVFGSVLLHLANILMSMLSSGSFDVAAKTKATAQYAGQDDEGNQPNPCSFYLLNIFIDTTIGIPILLLLLKILHRGFLLTPLARPAESIRSGNYGHPPRATWWLKQSVIYFLGLFGMKLCVFIIFQLLPWIAWVGDWALRWTEGNEAIQITFVMFIFPLIMNALQYWIIDGFIKDPASEDSHYVVAAGEESDDESGDEAWLDRHRRARREDDDDDSDVDSRETEPLKEANPLPVPAREVRGKGKEYDPEFDGAQHQEGSSRRGA